MAYLIAPFQMTLNALKSIYCFFKVTRTFQSIKSIAWSICDSQAPGHLYYVHLLLMFSMASSTQFAIYSVQLLSQLPTNHTHLGQHRNAWSRVSTGAIRQNAHRRSIPAQDVAERCIQLPKLLDPSCSWREKKTEAFGNCELIKK